MKYMDVKDLFKKIEDYENKDVVLEGWVRNNRNQSNFGFIDFNDGTYFQNLQLVYDKELSNFDMISKIRVGSAIRVNGTIIKSQGSGQSHEMKVKNIEVLGDCPEDYPIQPKRHTREFLREFVLNKNKLLTFNVKLNFSKMDKKSFLTAVQYRYVYPSLLEDEFYKAIVPMEPEKLK